MADETRSDVQNARGPGGILAGLGPVGIGFGVFCLGLLIADLFFEKHGPFAIEHVPGFYAVAGALGVVAIGLVARLIGTALRVDEDIYDQRDP